MEQFINGAILLLGEGDFSFTIALLLKKLLDNKTNKITSSVYYSKENLITLHSAAKENIERLESNEIEVLFSVDARCVNLDERLAHKKFNTIIFNFPHIGGKSNIKQNKALLKDFFKSTPDILDKTGNIIVTLCNGQGGTPADVSPRLWGNSWQIVSMATEGSLVLNSVLSFDSSEYLLYSSTGFKGKDRHFHLNDARIHIFKKDHINDNTIKTYEDENVESSYIAERLNRHLHLIDGHPLQILCQKIFSHISSISANLSQKNIIINSSESKKIVFSGSHLQSLNVYHYGNDTQKMLRSSLTQCLEGLADSFHQVETLYCMAGDVFNKCSIGINSLPITHQCLMFVNTNKITLQTDRELVDKILHLLLEELIPSSIFLKKRINFGDGKIIEDTVSETIYTLSAEKADLFSDCPPHIDYTMNIDSNVNLTDETQNYLQQTRNEKLDQLIISVGQLKHSNSVTQLFITIELDPLVQLAFKLQSTRWLWTKNISSLRESVSCGFFKPYSIYPPTWKHDLTFWESDVLSFDEFLFMDIIRDISEDLIREIKLINFWKPENSVVPSRCYRMLYQSCDTALSYAKSHRIQSQIRLTLAQKMKIQLR